MTSEISFPFRVNTDTLLSGCCYCSVAQSCPTPCDPMDCITPGAPSFTISQSLLKLMFIKSMMPSKHLILCSHLLLPSIFPSIRIFFNESAIAFHILTSWRFPTHPIFSLTISPSPMYSGKDWFWLNTALTHIHRGLRMKKKLLRKLNYFLCMKK